MKHKERSPVKIKIEGAYLNRLGKRLLRYFPKGQVLEILDDYQEPFSMGQERGGTDESPIAALAQRKP